MFRENNLRGVNNMLFLSFIVSDIVLKVDNLFNVSNIWLTEIVCLTNYSKPVMVIYRY